MAKPCGTSAGDSVVLTLPLPPLLQTHCREARPMFLVNQLLIYNLKHRNFLNEGKHVFSSQVPDNILRARYVISFNPYASNYDVVTAFVFY